MNKGTETSTTNVVLFAPYTVGLLLLNTSENSHFFYFLHDHTSISYSEIWETDELYFVCPMDILICRVTLF